MTVLLAIAAFLVVFIIGALIASGLWDRRQESAWRREAGQAAPQRGRHRALKPLPAVIPRKPTEHEPPWMPAPPVLKPDTIISGPPEPEPGAYFIATGPVIAGQPVLTHYTELPPPVAELLGYPSVGAAMDALCAGLHSWESNFTKGDSRFLRALTDRSAS